MILKCRNIGKSDKNTKNIKIITIEGVEYKISQYTDDTSHFLDGLPETVDGILKELHFFANISGLQINFSKTKMIWIGSKKNNQKKCFIIQDGNLIDTFHLDIFVVDMTSVHGEENWQEMFGVSILELDCASCMMHLNF